MNPMSWIEISKSALLHNIAAYKKLLNPTTKLAPVIKSNAYGHGILEVAHILENCTLVDYLCVVSLSEGLMLRKAGIAKPLLVLSIIDAALEEAVINAIDIVVYDFATAQALSKIAQNLKKYAVVHIKIDTGLSRLGIHFSESYDFIRSIQTLSGIMIKGIFSHFAASERSDLSFSHTQLERFNTLIATLKTESLAIDFYHFSCSAALLALPESHFNFARLGIGLYGLWPCQENKVRAHLLHPDFSLQPVMKWKTRIIARKKLPAESYIGYDCTYKTQQETEIAILPIGYFDGYDRKLSNQSMVKINNQFFPVRGKIAMNLCMIDVTSMPSIAVGQEVTLLGSEHFITADMLAEQTGTINYEIVARINPLLQRIIVT